MTGPTEHEPLTEADYQALARFRTALRHFARFSEEAARGAGITPAQHQLMLAIRGWDGEGAPSINDVARVLLLRQHSTSELVDRARDAGLVERTTDRHDGRRHLLALTPGGEGVLANLSQLHRDELRRFREVTLAQLLELG
jgi:DNA-binding MarR family transcriptional regulator